MKDQTENKNSRRKFLVRTSAVSLISALPATSVWGACTVSGALSGGSKVNGDCTTVILGNGRSPGSWRDFTNGEKIASAFPYLQDYKQPGKNADNTEYECEKTHLINIIIAAKNVTIVLGKDEHGSIFSINIEDALNSTGGIAWNLAAVYLNAQFGFYNSYLPITLNTGDTITNGEELIKHLFALDVLNPEPYDEDTYYGFTDGDGSTNYEPTASTNC